MSGRLLSKCPDPNLEEKNNFFRMGWSRSGQLGQNMMPPLPLSFGEGETGLVLVWFGLVWFDVPFANFLWGR